MNTNTQPVDVSQEELEAVIAREHTYIADGNEPDVYFSVDSQHFRVTPNGCENAAHANWFRNQISRALATLVRAYAPGASSASPLARGVTFLVTKDDHVLLERCPKKKRVLGVGEWFVPGGKIESGETPMATLLREAAEELDILVTEALPLPLIEGSRIPAGGDSLFLMQPYLVQSYDGQIPEATMDHGVELRWIPVQEALRSEVPQVRMMVAAALQYMPAGV